MFKNFQDFKEFCELIANQHHTGVEFHEYPEYRFGQATFMTDKFGGTYCCFKFDYDTLEVVDSFDTEIKPYTNYADLIIHIAERREREESLRNFDELYDFINSQY